MAPRRQRVAAHAIVQVQKFIGTQIKKPTYLMEITNVALVLSAIALIYVLNLNIPIRAKRSPLRV